VTTVSDQESADAARAPAIRASDAEREQVADLIRRAVGDGRLTVVEGDERQAQAYAAVYRHDLPPVVADLEPLPPPPSSPSTAVVERPGTSSSIAVMGSTARTGEWTPGLAHLAVSVMGGTELDLRHARLDDRGLTLRTVAVMGGATIDLRGAVGSAGITVVSIAFMGGTEVVVDEETTVDVQGIGLMGGFADQAGPPSRLGGPVVHVTGFALWGGVSVIRRPLALEPGAP
jgi:hypothetical protein